MQFGTKNSIHSSLLIFFVAAFVSAPTLSASLDSPAAVTNASSAMFTIEDLYNRLNAGTAGTKRTTVFTEPVAGPGVTAADHDLDEVMAIAPSVDDTNGATAAEVLNGKTFWGIRSGVWGLQTGTGTIASNPAIVPKTGQTSCYDISGTLVTCTGLRHDGDLQRGIAHAATRFLEPDDGTLTDQSTGLIWLQQANCILTNNPGYDPGGSPDGAVNWQEALDFVDGLNNGTYSCDDFSNVGTYQTDWRLPNVKELQSLIDFQNTNPALSSSHPFQNVQSSYYWTSTSHTGLPAQAWAVDLGFGNVRGETKNAAEWYVWPVRGGQ